MVAAKTEDKYIYWVFANAADDIKKLGEHITLLRGFNKTLYTPYSILLLWEIKKMLTKKVEEVSTEERFKRGVRAMLTARKIKNFITMYIWMRDQKQLAVDANYRRVYKIQEEMSWLEEMIDEDEKVNAQVKTVTPPPLYEIDGIVRHNVDSIGDKEIADK